MAIIMNPFVEHLFLPFLLCVMGAVLMYYFGVLVELISAVGP